MSEVEAQTAGSDRVSYKACQALAANGTPCAAPAREGRPFCVVHDPSADSREIMALARKAGGRAAAALLTPVAIPMDLSTPSGVLAMLSAVGLALAEGRLDRGRGAALTQLGARVLDALRGQALEEQIAQIRRDLAALRGGDGDED